ncbi:MAG: hypothetical protein JSS81_20120 [Acidobacteria bacterium]|nr:hypothetical protein [Acidobacteriota bacterium]
MKNIMTTEVLQQTLIEEKQGFFKRLFGCWHQRMSRPVTSDNTTFCYCKDCGLRRKYDIETGRPHGAFYSARPSKAIYFV